MPATFIEGVGEVVLPCSLGLLLPGVAAVLLGWWRSTLAAAVYAAAAALAAWLRAADMLALNGEWFLALILAIAIASAWVAWRSLAGIVVSASLLGVFAGSTWRPCVGDRLASVLNNAPNDPLAELPPMVVYVAGVTLVLVGLALLPLVWPQLRVNRPRVAPAVGSIVAAIILLATLFGAYGTVLSEFAQLTVR